MKNGPEQINADVVARSRVPNLAVVRTVANLGTGESKGELCRGLFVFSGGRALTRNLSVQRLNGSGRGVDWRVLKERGEIPLDRVTSTGKILCPSARKRHDNRGANLSFLLRRLVKCENLRADFDRRIGVAFNDVSKAAD